MRSRTPDRLCLEAIGLARAAAEELAGAGAVGEHLGAEAEPFAGDRVVTHYFACKEPAYRGWRWAVTVARASRSRHITVDETVLLPGTDALLAPEWVPWSERLRPGDMGPGDLLPVAADDPRLEPGWNAAGDEAPETAAEPRLDEPAALLETAEPQDTPSGELPAPELTLEPTADAEGDAAAEASPRVAAATERGAIASVALQLGLARPRVPSRYGLESSAERWYEEFGPGTPMAQGAPARCESCGFLSRIGGRLGQAFGVCSNEYSPADGRVVSFGYGCGGHSEAAVMPAPPVPPPPVLDDLVVVDLPLDAPRGPSEPASLDPDEELGHA